MNVRDPDAPAQFVDTCILESQPFLVQDLVQSQFRAVRIAAGDNVSIVLNHEGSIRAWGGFRVSRNCEITECALTKRCDSLQMGLSALTTMTRTKCQSLNL